MPLISDGIWGNPIPFLGSISLWNGKIISVLYNSLGYCKYHLNNKLKVLDNFKILCTVIISVIKNGNSDVAIHSFIGVLSIDSHKLVII